MKFYNFLHAYIKESVIVGFAQEYRRRTERKWIVVIDSVQAHTRVH
jgi:hypothetical protein